MIIKVDDEFLEKVDFIERINGYKNKSDTVRKTIEKEYQKERENEVFRSVCDGCKYFKDNCEKLAPWLRGVNQYRCNKARKEKDDGR